MDSFKLDFWEGAVPKIINVDGEIIKDLKKNICANFLLKETLSKTDIFTNILERTKYIDDITNLEKRILFLIKKISGNIKNNSYIYLDWGGLRNIKKVKLIDFITNIHNFWYPSSDDICIYDFNCKWILILDHHGGVSVSLP